MPPKMKIRRPKAFAVGPVRVRAFRGPKDGGLWYWRAERHEQGRHRSIWSGWASRDEAARLVAGLVASGLPTPEKAEEDRPIETVEDLLAYWIGGQKLRQDIAPTTIEAVEDCAERVIGIIGDVLLDRVDARTLERYRDTRTRPGPQQRATTCTRNDLEILRRAWRWGRELGVVPDRDLPKVRLNARPAPKVTPTRDQVVRVLDQLSGWPRLVFLVLATTGARIGEVASTTWSQVDIDSDFPAVRFTGKTGARDVPLAPEVVEALRAWRAQARAVGAGDRLWPVAYNTIVASGFRRALDAACDRARVPRFSPHALRRYVTDQLFASGVDVGTEAALLGHSPQTALRYYRQATEQDRRRAIQRARLGALTTGRVLPFRRAAGDADPRRAHLDEHSEDNEAES